MSFKRDRPSSSRGLYYSEYCAHCGGRACQVQSLSYDPESEEARRVCPYATGDAIKCTGPCCHGCQCTQDCDCDDHADCPCDCHCWVVRLHRDGVPPMNCSCALCLSGRAATEYYDEASGGIWVTNRPRDCRHFAEGGRHEITTYYDNSDCTNYCIERYFTVK